MFKDLKTLNDTINLSQMDKDTTDYLTLSDIYAFAGSDKKAIRMTHITIEHNPDGKHFEEFYIHTELGKVFMPRHLNDKLLAILEEDYYVDLMNRGELGIQVYRYQYENRHGYSVRFVRTPAWHIDTDEFHNAYTNWNNQSLKSKINDLYGVGPIDPYETCEYTNDPCFEHDCDLCPYNPYQE